MFHSDEKDKIVLKEIQIKAGDWQLTRELK